MSKTKGQMFLYSFGNETKMFWYCSQISLIENRLFGFCQESWAKKQGSPFSFWKELNCFCGTFVERLLLYCFDITRRGGGGDQREGYRGDNSQGWFINTSMTDCISSL
jgi:hypothetical protein